MKNNGRPKEQRYIVLDGLNFDYTLKQIELFDQMWNEGKSIFEIAKRLQRTQNEVACIIIDRAMKGYIEPRMQGIF